ncbi:hypothetical protein CAPTEDRAFT_197787 [Capitella teleta]|uniref:Uncharacterized protein n=1 Tax=Capitella teleta TaxID=283909 RepID=R7TJW6_CAPTE|nr:hypothetical protein CAPTEDRAFT_197787 [Capitella teleta]|eukprot:ELT94014.1 hypothetical protein CAPTEDRAFT_197787 [Capitella teleta]
MVGPEGVKVFCVFCAENRINELKSGRRGSRKGRSFAETVQKSLEMEMAGAKKRLERESEAVKEEVEKVKEVVRVGVKRTWIEAVRKKRVMVFGLMRKEGKTDEDRIGEGLQVLKKSPKEKRANSLPWKPVDQESALAFIDGKNFAFGGYPASKSVKSINLKESNSEWKNEGDMLHALERPLVVQFANKVYAFGGSDEEVTQEFDPALNEWRMRRQMPGRCYYGAVVALGDKIHVQKISPEVIRS